MATTVVDISHKRLHIIEISILATSLIETNVENMVFKLAVKSLVNGFFWKDGLCHF